MNVLWKLISFLVVSFVLLFATQQDEEPASDQNYNVRMVNVVNWEKDGKRGIETKFYRGDSHVLTEFVVLRGHIPVSKRFEFYLKGEVPLIWSIESPGITIIENKDQSTNSVNLTDFGTDGVIDLIGIETSDTKKLFEVYLIRSPWKIEPISGELWLKTRDNGFDWLLDEGLRAEM